MNDNNNITCPQENITKIQYITHILFLLTVLLINLKFGNFVKNAIYRLHAHYHVYLNSNYYMFRASGEG